MPYANKDDYNANKRKWYAANKDRLKATKRLRMQKRRATKPEQVYNDRMHRAEERGIEWLFTFESWWNIWKPFWKKRGRKSEDLCMARFEDKGPYSPENVRICTNRENHLERVRNQIFVNGRWQRG